MRKLFWGAILGAAAMYFLDPERGGERRQMISGLWSDQKETVLEAARTTAGAVSRVSSKVGDVLPIGEAPTNGSPVASSSGSSSAKTEEG
jgi:hypothetical protein